MDQYYFSNIEGIDDLRLECIFYEFEEEPILFLCKSDKDELYFCLCSEIRWGQRWILVKTQLENLKSLAEKCIDIATLFSNSEKVVIIDMDLQGKETCKFIDSKNIDRIDLPEDGIFLRCNKTDISEYLRHSIKECKKDYINVNYSNIYNLKPYNYSTINYAIKELVILVDSGMSGTIVCPQIYNPSSISHSYRIQSGKNYKTAPSTDIFDNVGSILSAS